MPLLDVKNLSVFFKTDSEKEDYIQAVKGVSFSVEKGEVLGIVGESGSGKSVSALSVLGLLPYPRASHDQKSSVKFEGRELLYAGETFLQKIRGNEISFIFQEPMSSLNPLHTIEKQISETLMLHRGMNAKDARKEAVRLLKLTGIKNAQQRLKSYPFELSGGQRQRVMIAMAVANNPKLLIADEPTTALDVTIQAQIIDLLLDLRKKLGMSIIFISHDLSVIRKIADKVCVMKDGKIVEQGSITDVFENPKSDYTKTLINSHLLLKNNDKKHLYSILDVKKMSVVYPIKKNFLGKVVEELKAVDEVSLSLMKGETLGIVGESGSGKTTLGLAAANLIRRNKGDVCYNFDENHSVSRINEKYIRKNIQIVFQDPYNSLNPRMNIEEIVGEGLDVHFSSLSAKEKKSRIVKVLKEVGLNSSILSKYPHEFSGGQRQRIAIARALVLEPEILVLDEPTSALDVTIQMQIVELLNKIQQDRNLSYIFISHDMNAIKAVSDRVAVMKDGKLVELKTATEIFNCPENDYTKKLIAAAL